MRLIDADEIPYTDLSEGHGFCWVTFMDWIKKMPTVEVVRCKDCKYGEVDDADFPNQYFCNHHGCSWNEGNHYCSYGERVENEQIH